LSSCACWFWIMVCAHAGIEEDDDMSLFSSNNSSSTGSEGSSTSSKYSGSSSASSASRSKSGLRLFSINSSTFSCENSSRNKRRRNTFSGRLSRRRSLRFCSANEYCAYSIRKSSSEAGLLTCLRVATITRGGEVGFGFDALAEVLLVVVCFPFPFGGAVMTKF